MLGMNSIHPQPVAAPTDPVRGTSPTSLAGFASAFTGAGNVPRGMDTDARPSGSRTLCGAVRAALAWVRNVIAHALPSRQPSAYDVRALATWARSGDASENRAIAEARIHAYLDSGSHSLDLEGLGLRELPRLPPNIETLKCAHNRLTTLPTGIASLPSLSRVELHGNPLDAPTLQRVREWNDAGRAPRFRIDEGTPPGAARALTLEASERTDALYPEFAFDKFVARLKSPLDAPLRPELVEAIDAFRERVKADKPLFDRVCAMAFGANASCEDRPILAWLDMLRAEESAAMEAGRLDDDPGKLIDVLRHNQRLAEVDRLAAGIAEAQGAGFNEAIETHLHLRLAVADLLPRIHGILDGRNTSTVVSRVTDAHVQQARERLAALETELPGFASNWAPWQALLRRQYPEAAARAEARLAALAEDPARYIDRVRAHIRLENPGAEDDAEAQIQAGPAVLKQLNHDAFGPLTARFLHERGIALS